MFKRLVFIALAVTLVAASEKDLFIGNPGTGRLIRRDDVKVSETVLGKAKISKTFGIEGYNKITQIKALDQHTNGHGATVTVTAGGIDSAYVTLKFESEPFRSIDYVVEIYGV